MAPNRTLDAQARAKRISRAVSMPLRLVLILRAPPRRSPRRARARRLACNSSTEPDEHSPVVITVSRWAALNNRVSLRPVAGVEDERKRGSNSVGRCLDGGRKRLRVGVGAVEDAEAASDSLIWAVAQKVLQVGGCGEDLMVFGSGHLDARIGEKIGLRELDAGMDCCSMRRKALGRRKWLFILDKYLRRRALVDQADSTLLFDVLLRVPGAGLEGIPPL